MFYPFYKSIKDRITSQVTSFKDVQWFNDQYSSGRIHAEPIVFIEFPDIISISGISKNTDRSVVPVTIHVVSKAMGENDASISDKQLQAHDLLADGVRAVLDNYPLTYQDQPFGDRLKPTGYRAAHEYKGWLVAKIFYSVKEIE